MALNWGILGASKFARDHMAPALLTAENTALMALATGSADKAAPFVAMAPGLKVHATYEALLADPNIDAVYIPLPNHMHVEWAHKAIAAGKHVLCEKPMTLRAEEFDGLIAARDTSGLLVAEAYMIAHHPQWADVRVLLSDGAIGQLLHVTGAFTYNNADKPGNIRNQAAAGGGGLRDIGVYTMGSVRLATGQEPQHISARMRQEDGYDTFTEVRAEFAGFTYSAYVSTRMSLHQEMVFHGSTGMIRLTAPFNPGVFREGQVILQRAGHDEQIRRYNDINQYKLQAEAFARSAKSGAPYACPLEFSRGTQVMMDAVFTCATSLK
ncbi:Gfo/Idh/MocA family oxidoreductase [Cognatishimia sp. SS12]|uniref:Gfo/Idh/MocA family protein n=1 Tax=Cognatishimia sp. SS12 TaxID=2979465 RepID=UPI00233143B2|nr:Gfo/Idh/MocA family oxidoreductase [Cognatishimia sp. SS12]MDC0739657.1 Gfo/Idh/MocA family oxidoreductase [Cognatishimia sp. SS12]